MNTRLRIFLVILTILCAANGAWHLWKNWGLVTIDATDRPFAEVLHSVERQAGVRLASNLPAEAKITIHVHKVTLLHALNVLAASANANWSLAYFVAPDKPALEHGLTAFSTEDSITGWKHFTLPQMRGMGYEAPSSDPRTDRWDIHAADDRSLHNYLTQGSLAVFAEFWAPETWNPAVSSTPKAGALSKVLPKLATAAHGVSSEVFLFSKMGMPPGFAAAPRNDGDGRPAQGSGNANFMGPGGFSDDMRKAAEQRMEAHISQLPPEKRAAAQADLEGRRKFFAELATLSPEERRAKILDALEKVNTTKKGEEMEAQGMQRGAMMTADQRNDFNRRIVAFKSTMNQ